MMAYFPMPQWSNERLKGAPSWVTSDLYDVVAKVAPEDVAAWQAQEQTLLHKDLLQTMLQAALAERCKLVVHRTTAESTGYELIVDKQGSRLKDADANAKAPERVEGGSAFSNTSMTELVQFLAMTGRSMVQNRTGLGGRYDFVLMRKSSGLPEDGSVPDAGPAATWDLAALGLRLDRSKVPVDTVLVDHIEKPTEN